MRSRSLLFWFAPAALAAGLSMVGCGSSGRGCIDACSLGEQRCSSAGNGYELCGDHDADGCLEWGAVVPCAQGEHCSNGGCQSEADGLVLAGGLMPAAGTMEAGGLRLAGRLATGFSGRRSSGGAIVLEHVSFTSGRTGDQP